MAVYKIFPFQDTTLYSMYPTMNTGIDPINQISNLNFAVDSQPSVARSLIKFLDSDIDNVFNNYITGSYSVNLRSFIATAQGIVESSILEVWPVATQEGIAGTTSNWNQGTGTYLDQPLTTDGACWESPFFAGSSAWPGVVDNISMSFDAKYAIPGGGAWYTGSTSTSEFNITASFGPRSRI